MSNSKIKSSRLLWSNERSYVATVMPSPYQELLNDFAKAIGESLPLSERSIYPRTTVIQISPHEFENPDNALSYFDRVDRAWEWVEQAGYVDNALKSELNQPYYITVIPRLAGAQVAAALMHIYEERATEAQNSDYPVFTKLCPDEDSGKIMERLSTAYESFFRHYLGRDNELEGEQRKFWHWFCALLATEAIIKADTQATDKDNEAWGEVFQQAFEENLANIDFIKKVLLSYSKALAEEFLNEYDPKNTSLEKLKELIFADKLKPPTGMLTVGTSSLLAHQHRYLASKKPTLAEPIRVRRSGKPVELAVRSSLELPRGVTMPSAEDVLQRMQSTLLKRKANGASLLKTHLYLIDRAYRAGGEEPRFEVLLDDLLEAKGYKRQSYGDFDASTYREEYGRIVTLGASWITLWEVKGKDKRRERYVDQTPYWDLRARRKLEDGDSLGLQPVLLAQPFAPIIKAVLMEPGLWWRASRMGAERIEIPRAILALPTDGKGNEAERIAVQLAATLAIWIRASQFRHAGKACKYSVGALLEASGVTTHSEFMNKHVEQAKRLRRYLASEDGTAGALATLREVGAFNIDIADEKMFWASGRGWMTKFWEAHLAVKIQDLGIKRRRAIADA